MNNLSIRALIYKMIRKLPMVVKLQLMIAFIQLIVSALLIIPEMYRGIFVVFKNETKGKYLC